MPTPNEFVEMRDWTPERPIERPDEDALDRGQFVSRLCRALIDEKTKRSSGVVVGVTGPWGSGKSSILNLLHNYIVDADRHPDAVIVRFDPWLVSGRDDLIAQFFAELVGAIKGAPGLKEKGKQLAKALASYCEHLAPIANLVQPGSGAFAKLVIRPLRKALDSHKGLRQQREEVRRLLESVREVYEGTQ